jgi:hypothetical protein
MGHLGCFHNLAIVNSAKLQSLEPGSVVHAYSPATQETDVGGSLEPRNSRPAWVACETQKLAKS